MFRIICSGPHLSQEKALHKRPLYPYVLQTPQIHVQTKHISFEASVSSSTR